MKQITGCINLKIALIMNQHSYCGREYLSQLMEASIEVSVISIGKFPEVNKLEDKRCGNGWIPLSTDLLKESFEFFEFDSLKNEELLTFLSDANFDLGLQGGTGILRDEVISKFGLGILNFHPGDLPGYRGCSAPEWQLYEGKPVVTTCHLVDAGIDTGEVIEKFTLNLANTNYEEFRSGIYSETAKFVVEVVKKYIKSNGHFKSPQKQDESIAQYREYIGDDRIEELKKRFPINR